MNATILRQLTLVRWPMLLVGLTTLRPTAPALDTFVPFSYMLTSWALLAARGAVRVRSP